MNKFRISIILLLGLMLTSCFSDPGSNIEIDLEGDTCVVSMSPREEVFEIQMVLTCDENGQNCYQISALSCQGVDKASQLPIDLTALDGCPGNPYCISDCAAGLDAPGNLWDMPSLLAIDGCNIYED
jgi:hypothetical protein